MKGILTASYPISVNEILTKDSEVEVISKWDDENYICQIPGGRRVIILAMCLKITDHSPYVDWEQRRYELAKSAMQGYCASSGLNGGNLETCKKIAIESLNVADAVIKQLKK